jgi:hypothetical protein
MFNDSLSPPREDGCFEVLCSNAARTREIAQALLFGKHIDPHVSEMFHFLESYQESWERLFNLLGYQLIRKELGATPFYYLSAGSSDLRREKLSQGGTFLGLFLARYFFTQGPGSGDHVSAEEIFRLLTNTYSYARLRPVFFKTAGSASSLELSEDQADRFKAQLKSDLNRLARYRFLDLSPGSRAPFADLLVYRLPALHRFWELALQLSETGDGLPDMEELVARFWGSGESSEPESENDDEGERGNESEPAVDDEQDNEGEQEQEI